MQTLPRKEHLLYYVSSERIFIIASETLALIISSLYGISKSIKLGLHQHHLHTEGLHPHWSKTLQWCSSLEKFKKVFPNFLQPATNSFNKSFYCLDIFTKTKRRDALAFWTQKEIPKLFIIDKICCLKQRNLGKCLYQLRIMICCQYPTWYFYNLILLRIVGSV